MLETLKVAAIAFTAAVVITAPTTALYTLHTANKAHAAELQKQELNATKAYSTQLEKVRELEKQLADYSNQLQVKHNEGLQQVEALLSDNRRLSRQLGGLRDPGTLHRACPSASETSPSSQLAGSPANGQLSAEASDFLLEFAADADRVSEYAKTCYKWANGLQ